MVLPYWSWAVTVIEKAVPAVALAGAVTWSWVVEAAPTVMVPLVPLIVPVTVSVAVMVRLPAWVRVTALVKVWVPLSPATKV